MARTVSFPVRLLWWCIAGAAATWLVIWYAGSAGSPVLSPIFRFLLTAFDGHANALLLLITVCAFFLRRHPGALRAVELASSRPWLVAAGLLPLLCIGALRVYHDYPLSMDEYAALFQAKAFAGGAIAGRFPPELLDRLIPTAFQHYFFTASRVSGEVSANYWPGFALLIAPFAWLGAPWAVNPLLGALTIPALHRLTHRVTGSHQAAGWSIALAVASPAFVVTSISYYSMQAHLLCNLVFAALLIAPSWPRALLAGLIGSFALVLHNPLPHALFALPFVAWLLARGQVRLLGALLLGYVPLCILLGLGWQSHLIALGGAPAAEPAVAAGPARSLLESAWHQLLALATLPDARVLMARIAGLAKTWTWAAPGLLVLAAYGYGTTRGARGARLLALSLTVSFFGYFLVGFDQGHGWGYRYLHPAWFVLPLFAGAALAAGDKELHGMAAWMAVLSLVMANGLRFVQVDSFITRQLGQVPPLLQAIEPPRPQIVFIDERRGFYTRDLVQNDPFLRAPRITMVLESPESAARLMANRFPGYKKTSEGAWGEAWTKLPDGR